MRVSTFCEKYDITSQYFYMNKYQSSLPETAVMFRTNSKILLVNEQYFIKRKEFQRKLYKENLDTYYLLHDIMTDTQLARHLSKKTGINLRNWQSWINQRLWDSVPESILRYRISDYVWHFHHYTRQLVKGV